MVWWGKHGRRGGKPTGHMRSRAENKLEVELGYKALRSTSSDPCCPVRCHLLKAPCLSQRALPTGNHHTCSLSASSWGWWYQLATDFFFRSWGPQKAQNIISKVFHSYIFVIISYCTAHKCVWNIHTTNWSSAVRCTGICIILLPTEKINFLSVF